MKIGVINMLNLKNFEGNIKKTNEKNLPVSNSIEKNSIEILENYNRANINFKGRKRIQATGYDITFREYEEMRKRVQEKFDAIKKELGKKAESDN